MSPLPPFAKVTARERFDRALVAFWHVRTGGLEAPRIPFGVIAEIGRTVLRGVHADLAAGSLETVSRPIWGR